MKKKILNYVVKGVSFVKGMYTKCVTFVKDMYTKSVMLMKSLSLSRGLVTCMTLFMLLFIPVFAFAEGDAGGAEAGLQALSTVTDQIKSYLPYVTNLCYAIAGIIAILGSISVYIAMNNEEQDVKKKLMLVIGSCIFFVAAAQALPLFFE